MLHGFFMRKFYSSTTASQTGNAIHVPTYIQEYINIYCAVCSVVIQFL
jgi:hypothetical protein